MKKRQSLEAEYELAYQISTVAHMHQSRWDGSPYIMHPRAVANTFESLHYKIVALLHDTIEDTECTRGSLFRSGISLDHINSIYILTHNENISYYDY